MSVLGVREDLAVVYQLLGGEGRIPTIISLLVSPDCQVGFLPFCFPITFVRVFVFFTVVWGPRRFPSSS